MKPLSLFSLLVLTAMLAVGCSGENDILDHSTGDPTAPVFDPRAELTVEDLLPELDYEEFHAVIDPEFSALFTWQLETWPGGCEISLDVSEDALPDGGDPVHYILRVPTRESYEEHLDFNDGNGLPLIIRLEPDGIIFQVPVTLTCTWMPWQQTPDLWTPVGSFGWTYDDFNSDPQNDIIITHLPKGKTRVSFGVGHFSDWEVGGRLGPPKDNDPLY